MMLWLQDVSWNRRLDANDGLLAPNMIDHTPDIHHTPDKYHTPDIHYTPDKHHTPDIYHTRVRIRRVSYITKLFRNSLFDIHIFMNLNRMYALVL